MMRTAATFLACATALPVAVPSADDAPLNIVVNDAPLNIVVITDWHNNPEYNASLSSKCRCTHWPGTDLEASCELDSPASTYGQYGCDSSPDLTASSLSAAAAAISKPDLVLVLGDLVTHDSPDAAFTHKTFHEMSRQIATAFPSTPYTCQTPLGNNDAFPNYGMNTSDPRFYHPQAETGKEFCGLTETEAAVFRAHGYYSRDLRAKDRLLILNTNLYASHNAVQKTNEKLGFYASRPATRGASEARHLEQIDPLADPDPLGQFAWIEENMKWAKANNGRVYIAAHIPPTLDSFSRAQQWQPAYAERYWALITAYPDVLGFHLFGHLHSAEVRALHTSDNAALQSAPALQILTSISPIYASNPSFYTLTANPATREVNLTMHSLELSGVHEGVPPTYVPMPPRPLDQSAGLLASNARYGELFESFLTPTLDESSAMQYARFFEQYKGGYHGKGLHCTLGNATFQDCVTCEDDCRASFVCLQAHGTNDNDYAACVDRGLH